MTRLASREGHFKPLRGIKRTIRVDRNGNVLHRDKALSRGFRKGEDVYDADILKTQDGWPIGDEVVTVAVGIESSASTNGEKFIFINQFHESIERELPSFSTGSPKQPFYKTKARGGTEGESFVTYDEAEILLSCVQTNFDNLTPEGGHVLKHFAKIPETIPGQDFFRFSKLPVELQRMIWRFAALEPSIVALKFWQDESPPNPLNYRFTCTNAWQRPPRWALRATCREAREVVMSFQEPLFYNDEENKAVICANWEVDTLWMIEPEDSVESTLWLDAVMITLSHQNFTNFDITTLAMSYDLWYRWSHDFFANDPLAFQCAMEDLRDVGVKELLLVVRGHQNRGHPDVVFRRPKDFPRHQMPLRSPGRLLDINNKEAIPGVPWTWENFEEEAAKIIKDFQVERAEARKPYLEEGKDEDWLENIMDLADCSDWGIERVRYVEAVVPVSNKTDYRLKLDLPRYSLQ